MSVCIPYDFVCHDFHMTLHMELEVDFFAGQPGGHLQPSYSPGVESVLFKVQAVELRDWNDEATGSAHVADGTLSPLAAQALSRMLAARYCRDDTLREAIDGHCLDATKPE